MKFDKFIFDISLESCTKNPIFSIFTTPLFLNQHTAHCHNGLHR